MIAIGSDHGGFDLKEAVIAHLKEKGYEVKDVGCYDKAPAIIRFTEKQWLTRWRMGHVRKES